MSLHITPEMMETVYEYLRLTPPFKGWKLPHADGVEFHVTRHQNIHGDFSSSKKRIRISTRKTFWTSTLIETMAHEMVHLHLDRIDSRILHGPKFQRIALHVCKHHGFDPKSF